MLVFMHDIIGSWHGLRILVRGLRSASQSKSLGFTAFESDVHVMVTPAATIVDGIRTIVPSTVTKPALIAVLARVLVENPP